MPWTFIIFILDVARSWWSKPQCDNSFLVGKICWFVGGFQVGHHCWGSKALRFWETMCLNQRAPRWPKWAKFVWSLKGFVPTHSHEMMIIIFIEIFFFSYIKKILIRALLFFICLESIKVRTFFFSSIDLLGINSQLKKLFVCLTLGTIYIWTNSLSTGGFLSMLISILGDN